MSGAAEGGRGAPSVSCRIAGVSRTSNPILRRGTRCDHGLCLLLLACSPAGPLPAGAARRIAEEASRRRRRRRSIRARSTSPTCARSPAAARTPRPTGRRTAGAGPPVDPSPLRLRPDLPHPRRRLGPAHPGLDRQGAHHLLLLHGRRAPHPLLLDSPLDPGLPGAPRPLARLRLADRPQLRDPERQARRLGPRPPDRQPRLRRRDHRLREGRLADLHLDARRRPRPLPHGRRRQERAAADRRPGYDGGAFFSPDCSKIVWRASRPKSQAELDDYRRLLAQGLVRPPSSRSGPPTPTAADARQVTYLNAASFGPSFLPSGPAHPLRLQLRRSQGAGVRHLGDQPRRHRPRADHLDPRLRRLSPDLARRHPPRLRLQPQRHAARGDGRLRGPLGGAPEGRAAAPAPRPRRRTASATT